MTKEEKKEIKGMPPSVTHRIRFYLREHGISQRALAEKMGTISQCQISQLLLGRYNLSEERMNEILAALGITYEELMGEENEPFSGTSDKEAEVVEDGVTEDIAEELNPWEARPGDVVDIDPEEDLEGIIRRGIEEVEDAEDGVIEEVKNEPIDESKPVEKVEETPKVADKYNPRAIYESMREEMLKEFQEELRRSCAVQVGTITQETPSIPPLDIHKYSAKTRPHPHQRMVDDLKSAAETIIKNAESMVGTEKSLGEMTVTIYLRPHEVVRINVNKDVYPEY